MPKTYYIEPGESFTTPEAEVTVFNTAKHPVLLKMLTAEENDGWDYSIIPLIGSTQKIETAFRTLGEDGWELVQVISYGLQSTAVFKRRLVTIIDKEEEQASEMVKKELLLPVIQPTEVSNAQG